MRSAGHKIGEKIPGTAENEAVKKHEVLRADSRRSNPLRRVFLCATIHEHTCSDSAARWPGWIRSSLRNTRRADPGQLSGRAVAGCSGSTMPIPKTTSGRSCKPSGPTSDCRPATTAMPRARVAARSRPGRVGCLRRPASAKAASIRRSATPGQRHRRVCSLPRLAADRAQRRRKLQACAPHATLGVPVYRLPSVQPRQCVLELRAQARRLARGLRGARVRSDGDAATPPRAARSQLLRFGDIRYLHLGTEWVQGSMKLDAPFEIELEYVQRMMAWLLFVEPRAWRAGMRCSSGSARRASPSSAARRCGCAPRRSSSTRRSWRPVAAGSSCRPTTPKLES